MSKKEKPSKAGEKHTAFVRMSEFTKEEGHILFALGLYERGMPLKDVSAYFATLRAICNGAFDDIEMAISRVGGGTVRAKAQRGKDAEEK